ncbi:MAG: hypothetical protein J6V66_06220 [Clostridia bacterium]|nr:hypothetical protein [Clostridia bacterium]
MKKLIAILSLIACILCFPACKDSGESLSVYAPDGAPALALSSAMEGVEGFAYNVVGADVITAKVSGTNPIADVAIIPINTASLLLGNGETYQMLGVVTHGNFYFLSKNSGEITRQNASELIGKTVGVVQLANVPGLTLKVALGDLNLAYNELKNGSEKASDKVNLLAIKLTEIGVADCDYYLAPSPVADAKSVALNLNFNGSLDRLYSDLGFPQAVLVAKKSVILSDFDKVKELVNSIKSCKTYLKIENKDAICMAILSNLESGLTPSFTTKNLTQLAIDRANIELVLAKNCKQEVNDFIEKIRGVNPNAACTINDEFFYLGEF